MKKHLYLNDFKELYKILTRFIPFKPLKLVILAYLIEIEDMYIDYKVKHEVTTSISSYLEDTPSEVDPLEGIWVDEFTIQSRWSIDDEDSE